MKPKVNIFGQKVCLFDDCPAYFTGEYGSACNAKLNHWGRVAAGDDGVQMGMLCHLPVEFELIHSEDKIMSDYREIEIIVNVIGKDNIMTDENAHINVMRVRIAVSESVTLYTVTDTIRKKLLSIEDVL